GNNGKLRAFANVALAGASLNMGSNSDGLVFGDLSLTGGNVSIGGGGELEIFGDIFSNASSSTATVTGPGTFEVVFGAITVADGPAAIDLDVAAPIQCAQLIKQGAGSLRLSNGGNSYTGPTGVSDGRLALSANLTSSSSISVTGGTLELTPTSMQNRMLRSPAISVTGSGRIDIQDNKIITASPVGSWTGSAYDGIT